MPRRAAGCSRLSRRLRRLRTPPADDRGGGAPFYIPPGPGRVQYPAQRSLVRKSFSDKFAGATYPVESYPVVTGQFFPQDLPCSPPRHKRYRATSLRGLTL